MAARSACRHHGLVVVESVATVPAHRRRGVARALLEGLCTWAEHHDAHAAVLAVENGNAGGQTAWRALALVEIGGWSYAPAPVE